MKTPKLVIVYIFLAGLFVGIGIMTMLAEEIDFNNRLVYLLASLYLACVNFIQGIYIWNDFAQSIFNNDKEDEK